MGGYKRLNENILVLEKVICKGMHALYLGTGDCRNFAPGKQNTKVQSAQYQSGL